MQGAAFPVQTRRGVLALAGATVLVGCAPRARFARTVGDGTERTRTVVLATNRDVLPNGQLGLDRTLTLRFAALDVAIPSNRRAGDTPFNTRGNAFSVADTRQLSSIAELRTILAAWPQDECTLWVHGFNNTAAEAVYRQAQMAEDFGLNGPQIAFVWPSAERGVGYLHDRDSVLHARAAFEHLIRLLARHQSRKITIVAHSLGSLLVMETLRQAASSANTFDPFLSDVVLFQPDLDPDLFRAQLADIGPTDVPLAVMISRDDPVLRLSARLSGQPRRLETSDDLQGLRALGIIVIDLSELDDDTDAHFAAATSPSAISLIRGLRRQNVFEEASTR